MKLKQNAIDPTILEDELGNPIFKFIGNHPGDIEEFVSMVPLKDYNRLEKDLLSAENDLNDVMYILDSSVDCLEQAINDEEWSDVISAVKDLEKLL